MNVLWSYRTKTTKKNKKNCHGVFFCFFFLTSWSLERVLVCTRRNCELLSILVITLKDCKDTIRRRKRRREEGTERRRWEHKEERRIRRRRWRSRRRRKEAEVKDDVEVEDNKDGWTMIKEVKQRRERNSRRRRPFEWGREKKEMEDWRASKQDEEREEKYKEGGVNTAAYQPPPSRALNGHSSCTHLSPEAVKTPKVSDYSL